MKVGDKVIITTNREGFRGEPAEIKKEDHGKYYVETFDGYYLGWLFPNELMPDKSIMLSDIMDKISIAERDKDDDSDYDWDDDGDERFIPDNEYVGWQCALNHLTEMILNDGEKNGDDGLRSNTEN